MIRNRTYTDIVFDYCESVASGEEIACRFVKQSIAKFLDEVERADRHDEDFPFEFDRNAVENFCGAFPQFLRHYKGEWAGQPFELLPWQVFFIANIHGWKQRSDGLRRFRRALLSVARKNGKTALCAGEELIFLYLDNEPGAEVYIGATKLDQAKLIHGDAESMVLQSPYLTKVTDVRKNRLIFPRLNGKALPLGSDKPFSGLNPSAILFDEFHEWTAKHEPFYSTMTTASGSRRQPLQLSISTAGNDASYLYNDEVEYARSVVDGEFVDNQFFAMIYELDEEDDPFGDDFDFELLRKSNPSFGVSAKVEYLESQLNEARNRSILKRLDFRRYHGNTTVGALGQAITKKTWDDAAGTLSDWSMSDGIGAGFDLGGQDDLASWALVAKFKVGDGENENGEVIPVYRFEARSKAYINEATDKHDLSKAPFAKWINEGQLIACQFPHQRLRTDLYEECESLGIQYVAYDPWNAKSTAEALELKGLLPVKCGQTQSHMTEPVRNVLDDLKQGRFKPCERDAVLRWCATNMALKGDAKGYVMPDKSKSKNKIDAMVAMLMARKACDLAMPQITGSLVL